MTTLVEATGLVSASVTFGSLSNPKGITVDGSGDVYFSDSSTSAVYEYIP